ncbi:MAG: 30S ribosomal protein S1 [Candidatus Margulisbacteria bacterium]|nr:30S ribosomal protein S1 [Candidatus Margulisiibacteriota bacterium]
MDEELKGTSLEQGKGDAGLSEVEELIRQTLEESKKLEKKSEPAPQSTAPTKKDEFKATSLPTQVKTPTPPPEKKKEETKISVGEKPKGPTTESSEYDQTFKEYKVGDIVKGKVLRIDPSGVLVDIKYKADGLIPTEELADKIPGVHEEALKVGDIIDVMIENTENKEGYAILSKKNADQEKKWRLASDAYRHKTVLQGKVLQALRGGLVVECEGIRGFVPASQVGKTAEETFESFVGKTIPLKVIEVNHRQGKIVLSHKQAAGEKTTQVSQKLLDELEVGQVRKGKVANLKPFGAFVDLGGIEGLIHLSELSWKRVKHPSEVLKSGQEIDVFVLGVDRINKKVSLGLKELQADPWVSAAELYKPGQIVKAKILRFAKFGAFAELEHGLEGLIHISELSKEKIMSPDEAAKIGETVDVKILRVIPEEQKIGLSVKAVKIDKERKEAKAAMAQQQQQQQNKEEEKKVTIGDMIAEKERAKAEKEAEEEEFEEQLPAEPAPQGPTADPPPPQ